MIFSVGCLQSYRITRQLFSSEEWIYNVSFHSVYICISLMKHKACPSDQSNVYYSLPYPYYPCIYTKAWALWPESFGSILCDITQLLSVSFSLIALCVTLTCSCCRCFYVRGLHINHWWMAWEEGRGGASTTTLNLAWLDFSYSYLSHIVCPRFGPCLQVVVVAGSRPRVPVSALPDSRNHFFRGELNS
jgi:hypothetical protein